MNDKSGLEMLFGQMKNKLEQAVIVERSASQGIKYGLISLLVDLNKDARTILPI